jgi:hypothetical protein
LPVASRRAKRGRSGGRLTLRAFARKLGVSHTAVEKAIHAGRLRKCVGRDRSGRPVIADVKLGQREWTEGASKPSSNGHGDISLLEAQRQVAIERARGLRLANRIKRGELLAARVVERENYEAAKGIRDAILNVPDRIAAELAAEPDAGRLHARLVAELRKALESIAEVLDEQPD